MASRTQIVCLCEGKKGGSIDSVFINQLFNSLNPAWLRPFGSNKIRINPCGGRDQLIKRVPQELRLCIRQGGDTTLMVWADCDDNCSDANALKDFFVKEALQQGLQQDQIDAVVFIFAKDRLENWIEYLNTGSTDESKEGPRVNGDVTREAAKKLAQQCLSGKPLNDAPASLLWSCANWHSLVERFR